MAGSNDKLRVLRRIPELRFEEELRGYNKHQVDRVLENLAPLADEVDILLDRLKQAETRAASAEARLMERPGADVAEVAAPPQPSAPDGFDNETISKTLLLAQQAADNKLREATEESDRMREAARSEATTVVGDANAEAERIRSEILAQRSTLMSQAETDVAGLVATAKSDLAAKVAAAESELTAAHEETRTALVTEIGTLRSQRDALVTDVEQFEGHLAARRETIREALADLTKVIEDPERLRTSMPPAPADVADVDPDALVSPALGSAVATSLDTDLGDTDVVDGGAPEMIAQAETATAAANTDTTTDTTPDVVTAAAPQSAAEVGAASEATQAAEATMEAAEELDLDATQALAVVDAEVSGDVALEDVATTAPAEPMPLTDAGDDAGAGEAVGVARPAWADAIPDADPTPPSDTSGDPFLDELRRVTNEPDEEGDAALDRFLQEDDDNKGGSWFSRRK